MSIHLLGIPIEMVLHQPVRSFIFHIYRWSIDEVFIQKIWKLIN